MAYGDKWTNEEIALLHKMYSDGRRDISMKGLSHRSESSVDTKARRLGLVTINLINLWTDKEIAILRKYYSAEGSGVSLRLPDRNAKAVFTKAYKLNLNAGSLRGGSKAIDETGSRYDRLVVLERAESPRGESFAFWLCKCDCGNTKLASGSKLRQGKVTSCGCKLDQHPKSLVKRYIANAKKRKLEWALSLEQFSTIIEQDCHYCGSPPSVHAHNHKWNGIDRVDNNKGYVVDNAVSCCSMCNKMKSCLGMSAFLDQCRQIAEHIAG